MFFNTFVNQRFIKMSVSYTHLRAHETEADLVCRLLLGACFFLEFPL